MLDKAIQEYLEERKGLWLKNRIKVSLTDEEILTFKEQAKHDFSLEVWMPNAAKRAKQLSIVSHPAKFSHPSAKTTSIINGSKKNDDGLLKSGNVSVELDVFGNAAALDVYKFLSLKLNDERSILEHLEQNSDEIKQQFAVGLDFEELKNDFLAIKQDESSSEFTSSLVKQIYFPIDSDYHLLSVLSSSGLITTFKQRIDKMHFAEKDQQTKKDKKDGKYSKHEYSNIREITKIGFGGTKPQNISYLNSKSGGISYLLNSVPPPLTTRKIRLPTKNFFSQTLWSKAFEKDFSYFHKILDDNRKNVVIRDKRDDVILTVIYKVANFVKVVRNTPVGWSDSDSYVSLQKWQKIWLDNKYEAERDDNDDYLQQAHRDCAKWFLNTYEYVLKKQKLNFDDIDLQHVIKVIDDDMEALK